MGRWRPLVHGGVVVTEPAAIIAYLADTFPAAELAPPPGDAARGTYYRWLFFGAGCIEPAVLDKLMKRPEIERKGAAGWGSYDDVVATLKKALAGGPYLLGDKFSAADVYIRSEIPFAMTFSGPNLKGDKVFDDYVARLSVRPAARHTAGG